jgi:CelD/BcsL family acetyltransferase involved in cellulose biosynthesis
MANPMVGYGASAYALARFAGQVAPNPPYNSADYPFLEALLAHSRGQIRKSRGFAAMRYALTIDCNQPIAAGAARLASAHVIEDLAEAEPIWRELQSQGAWSTPYQSFDFLAAWQRAVGARHGTSPFIVVSRDAHGRPLCVLPLGLQRVGPLRVVSFLGGKHANFNLGLWDRATAAAATTGDLDVIRQCIAASARGPDLLALDRQPETWQGIANPFRHWPHRPANIASARLPLAGAGPDVLEHAMSGSTRSRLRGKERKLQNLPGYRYLQASEPAEVDRMLDQFFELKIAHMTAQGLPNVFADAAVQRFLREASHAGLSEGHPAIELHALECDAELLALFGVLSDRQCMSVMINTYTPSENGRHSPGLVLVTNLIKECARRGITSFDLGVGESQYKSWFCKEPIVLFETILPLTPLGRLSSVFFETASALKQQIKSTPALFNAYRGVRRMLGGG